MSYDPFDHFSEIQPIELEIPQSSQSYTAIKKYDSFVHAEKEWNEVPFRVEVERIQPGDENEADLIMKISVNSKALDENWQIAFQFNAFAKFANDRGVRIEKKMWTEFGIADVDKQHFTYPLMKFTDVPSGTFGLQCTVQIQRYFGIYQKFMPFRSFTEKGRFDDLEVKLMDGSTLYASRALFHRCFRLRSDITNDFENNVLDLAARRSNVSADTLTTLLHLLDDQYHGDDVELVRDIDSLEELLYFAKEFGMFRVSMKLKEFLMMDSTYKIPGLTLIKAIRIANQYEHTRAITKALDKVLDSPDLLKELFESDDYQEITGDLKTSLEGVEYKLKHGLDVRDNSTRDEWRMLDYQVNWINYNLCTGRAIDRPPEVLSIVFDSIDVLRAIIRAGPTEYLKLKQDGVLFSPLIMATNVTRYFNNDFQYMNEENKRRGLEMFNSRIRDNHASLFQQAQEPPTKRARV